jgi:hypothetical protein
VPGEAWRAYTGHYRMSSPWTPANFYILLRQGRLYLFDPGNISYPAYEERLYPARESAADTFHLGAADAAETIRFADVVDGRALRARHGGSWYYRTWQT